MPMRGSAGILAERAFPRISPQYVVAGDRFRGKHWPDEEVRLKVHGAEFTLQRADFRRQRLHRSRARVAMRE